MNKTYNPNLIEQLHYKNWEEKKYFSPSDNNANPYCILLPPPNVTGSLHMGHGFGFSLMDVLIRYHRMSGDKTLWQPGTDHAGIATQMVVERQLAAQGINRKDLGREAFIKKIWEWKKNSGGRITQQLRRLGASLDWSKECFTLDDKLSHAVHEVFIQLFNEGLIYRGTRLVNWDPSLLTAISDLEVVNNEEQTNLWHIRYPLIDKSGYLTVATTRPETLLGDVAVAVNPDDERFTNMIGKLIKLPLTERVIPIIADDYVEQDFGSGCVKITPAHDFNDHVIGKRHGLTPINIFTPNAHLNENTPEQYRNMERFAARKKIIKDLDEQGLLEKIEKYTTKIPRGDRSGVIVEPFLTKQWFMKMESLAAPAIKAVKEKEIRITPANWEKTWFQWLENIEDWCISRQLWWGHRIPVWYDETGNAYAGLNEKDVRKKYQLDSKLQLRQDEDVLDTWFSSALWPFTTQGWPENTQELKEFYPSQVLVTGFDILFFWVARMAMLGLKITGKIPFKEVFITGLIRDHEGHKMSKSKGNVLDPLDLIDGITLDELVEKRKRGLMQPKMAQKIEKSTCKEFPQGIQSYGTDALRFTFCALASQNREISFDTNRLAGYRNFCNKLWNAARYVLMQIDDKPPTPPTEKTSATSNWIFSKLQTTIETAHKSIKEYRFDILAHSLYEFVWSDFCDWYLELSKPILTSEQYSLKQKNETSYTLITILKNILLLLHPVIPYITEEIWSRVAPLSNNISSETIMIEPYPTYDSNLLNNKAEAEIDWLKSIITAIRTLRSEMNIPPKQVVNLILQNGTTIDKTGFTTHETLIKSLNKIATLEWEDIDKIIPKSISTVVGSLNISIPMEGLINYKDESNRLYRDIAKISKEIEKTSNQLKNKNFIDRAPEKIITKEKNNLTKLQVTYEQLTKQLERIRELI